MRQALRWILNPPSRMFRRCGVADLFSSPLRKNDDGTVSLTCHISRGAPFVLLRAEGVTRIEGLTIQLHCRLLLLISPSCAKDVGLRSYQCLWLLTRTLGVWVQLLCKVSHRCRSGLLPR